MSRSERARTLAILLVFAAMGIFVARDLRITTGISHLLSETREQALARVSARLMDSELTRTMVLVVEAGDGGASLKVADAWARRLAGHPEVERIRSGPEPGLAEAVRALYFPRRFALLSSRPESEIPEELSDAGLARAAAGLREALALPRGQLVKAFAGADPWQVFARRIERFDAAREAGLDVRNGRFVDPRDGAAILFLTTRHSAFDASMQADLDAALPAMFAAACAETGVDARFERSSVHRFAVAAERLAVRDMEIISITSAVLVVLLFALLFRSLRTLVVSILPLLGGLLTATTVGLLVFGEIHVMTLAFGATLIGICIDYPIHFVVHHRLIPSPSGPQGSMARIWGALRLGAFTTVAGFLGLGWSDFPGVREIGVFAAVGVVGALFTTRWLLPVLVAADPRPTRVEHRLAAAMERLLAAMRRRRTALLALPLLGLVVLAAGLPGLALQDDVFALSLRPDSGWVAEEERVRERVARTDTARFAIVLADDEETALERNDALDLALEDGVADGELDGFRSLHTFLPSLDLQQRNWAVLRAQPRVAERTLAALEAAGFRPEAFAAFVEDLEIPPPPLRYADLAASPLADVVSSFHVDLGDQVAVLTFLRGVADPTALEARIDGVDGARLFDQQRFVGELYGRYRTRTLRLIGVGLVAVFGLLYARHRRLRWALATVAPALLAAGTTLALLSLAGDRINLLHLLGTLLVLSIGVDYAIFLVAPAADLRERAATLLSIAVACASTCLAFGLLAFSAFPALASLGATTALGVILSLLFAPTALVLAEASDETGPEAGS